MTETDNLAQQLRETQIAYQTALENSRFKAGFLGRIAHELRSPLSSLISLHQLIIADLCENPEEEKQCIQEAYQYAQKLMELIDKLVEVSQLEVGKFTLDLQPIQLSNILLVVKNLMDLQAANRNLKLQLLPIDEQITVLADQNKLSQLLFSLIEVAIDHCDFGTIILSVTKEEFSQQVMINLDLPANHLSISEPIDLIESPITEIKQLSYLPQLSTGMKIMLAQTWLEIMQGGLKITNARQADSMRLQLSLPLLVNHSSLDKH
jgi:signal transduction histidine kinase